MEENTLKNRSQAKEIWRRFKKNKAAMVGLVIVIIFVLIAIFANLIAPVENVTTQHIREKNMPPCAAHWFGTDALGRDIFARVIYGTRYSLMVGIITSVIAVVIGLILAALAAYYGGWVDTIIMRTLDVFTSIPGLILAMCVVAALGANTVNLFVSLVIISVPAFTRTIRSALLNIVSQEYIEAARACGTPVSLILTQHVLKNAMGTIIIGATMGISSKILTAATLSFLGLGFQPPTPEWGAMLADARQYIRTSGYMIVFPGIAIILSTMGINLMGDGLRDALDPKLKN